MKRTKKSLFISTVLMVVLLIVAISTATFAWYSSQETARANDGELITAGTTDANIGIFFGSNGPASEVTLATQGGIKPMVPKTDPATSNTATGALEFNEGIIAMNSGGTYEFKTINAAEAWKQKDATSDATTLFVQNLDTDAGRQVLVTPSIVIPDPASSFDTGAPTAGSAQANTYLTEAAEALRVAIYAKAAGAETYAYLGTYGKNTAVYGVPIAQGAVSTFGTSYDLTAGALTGFQARGGGHPVSILVYAWLEGPVITANHALIKVPFSINFVASTISPYS